MQDRGHKLSEGQLSDQPFRFVDSKRDVTLPRRPSRGCGTGYTGAPNTKWLIHCDNCKSGYHTGCTVWQPYRRICDGKDLYACKACLDERDYKLAKGYSEPLEEWKLLTQCRDGTAPSHAEAAEEDILAPIQTRPPSASGATPKHLQTPPSTRQPNFTFGSVGTGLHSDYAENPDQTFSDDLSRISKTNTTATNVSNAQTSIQAKDYFQWEPVPKDWTPKPDPNKTASPDDASPEHPDKGWGKQADSNWRRKNVTNRDSVRAANSDLGPLTRGLSQDMKIADPSLKWVDRLTDETLLEVLDKKFGVKNSDLFLTKDSLRTCPLLTLKATSTTTSPNSTVGQRIGKLNSRSSNQHQFPHHFQILGQQKRS